MSSNIHSAQPQVTASSSAAVFRGPSSGVHGIGSPNSSSSSYRSLGTRGTEPNIPQTQSSSRLTRALGGTRVGTFGTDMSSEMEGLSEPVMRPSFAKPEEFEDMVGDLRRVFIGWLKKTESELRKERDCVVSDRKTFEEEKKKAWKAFLIEKQAKFDKLQVCLVKREVDERLNYIEILHDEIFYYD